MSALENLTAAIERLTARTEEHTELLKALASNRGGEAAAPEAKSTKKAPAKAAAEAEDAPASKSTKAPSAKAGKAPKALSAGEMGEKAREFCEAADDDEDEFKARRALCTKLAKKSGVTKFSEIKDAAEQTAALAALKAHADAYADGEGEEEDEDEDEKEDY